MFPYGHNGAFVSLPLRNSYLFGSISYSTFLILFNSGFIVPCFGLALPLTVLQLGEGAENRSRNFQFSTDLSKTAWCCELTIFLAKTKRFLRQSKPKFSTYTELRSFAKLPVICSAFCSVGLEICRSSGGKFILFWRWGKEGREKLFCRLWFWCW